MAEHSVRLDGWKAIATYVKRDRSTVIRWRRNGLPVHHIPGARSAAVFAYKGELDAWLVKGGARAEEQGSWAAAGAPAASDRPWWWPAAGGLTAVMLVLMLTLSVSASLRPARPVAGLPSGPTMARLFLQARDDWAARTPQGLRACIAELADVIRQEPRFAPAYAALADAYILSPEFDDMPQGVAFGKARGAARSALSIDPSNADAERDLGFIAYWRDHDVRRARAWFAKALSAAPERAQTHFWYGNALIDNGEVAAGLAELQKARLLDPGSATLESDYAWASWENGSGDADTAALRAVETRTPSLSTAPYYLAQIAFAEGDVGAYLDQAEKWSSLQGGPDFIAQIAAQRAAFKAGGAQAVLDRIAEQAPMASEHMYDGTLWPAGAASLAGRRERMLELLARAEATRERWNPKRWERTLFSRWRGDHEVQAQLARLFRPQSPKDRLADLA